MKKTTIWTAMCLIATLGWSSLHAQATRLVLAEEFTQASCGPCASQNPAFNTLLQQNPTKIIDIKYQTSFPGVDPMNAHNPNEVASRRSYYGVNGVPHALIDGTSVTNDCNAYAGAPACLDQSEIDAAFNMSTPISLSVTHTLSSDLTTATVNVTLTNSGATTFTPNGNFYLRLALVESEINFPTAPGSNGELDFYGVMRKMVPNATGTALPASMTAGQQWTNQFTVQIPSYIYNYGEIAFVAFAQSDGDKMIHNAAHSAKQPVPSGFSDASITGNSTAGSDICDATFNPAASISNQSSTTITSADVHYVINGGNPVTQSWSGSLGQGASATVSFPATTLPGGSNSVYFYVDNVNGQVDYNTLNNQTAPQNYSVLDPTPQSAPYTKDFESNSIGDIPSEFIVEDPSGRVFIVDNQINSSVSWQLGAYEQSALSLRVDWWSIQAGTVSNIITEKVDLSSVTGGTPNLYFDHAYCQYQAENDMLDISISTDCGATWTSLWNKAGGALSTRSPSTSRFYPRSNEWTRSTIDLSAYASSSDAVFRFKATSDYGNSLYLDNIHVGSMPVSTEELELAELKLYPVPTRDELTISFDANGSEEVKLQLVNPLGAVVLEQTEIVQQGPAQLRLQLGTLAEGMYTLEIQQGDRRSLKKISVLH